MKNLLRKLLNPLVSVATGPAVLTDNVEPKEEQLDKVGFVHRIRERNSEREGKVFFWFQHPGF